MADKYLAIKNVGECPIEGLTVLGVSSSRGNSEAIGQFGSGAKHGILTCLRHGLNPVIYIGRTKISFYTEPAATYNKIFVKIGQKAPRELSMALEFGALDWDDVDMALREFVSNALDAADGEAANVSFKVCERITPELGTTIIAVPYTQAVQAYFGNLNERFLHFGKNKDLRNQVMLPKIKPGPANVYRKGVFIRTVHGKPSLFDYNFGDNLKIDEARNMDDYAVTTAVAPILGESEEGLSALFSSILTNTASWESDEVISHWRFTDCALYCKEMWVKTWIKTFGPTAVASPSCSFAKYASAAQANGYEVVCIQSTTFYDCLKKAGIPTIYGVLDTVNDKGHEVFEPTTACMKAVQEVWDWLVLLKLTQGKTLPPVKMFTCVMEGGSITRGYYLKNVIYIHTDNPTDKKIIVEELGHYITGASDCSRTFQDFAFRVAGAMMDV